jgi:hypothetical protein
MEKMSSIGIRKGLIHRIALGIGDSMSSMAFKKFHDGLGFLISTDVFHQPLKAEPLELMGVSSPGNSYSLSSSRTSIFHQLDQIFIVFGNLVSLVQEDDDCRYTYLTGKQDVLAGLGHN